MKTLFHYAATDTIKAMFAPELSEDFRVACCPEGAGEPFLSELPDTDVIWHVLQPLTAEALARAPRLKLVQKIGVGVNTIDLDYARANGIAVCNMPGTNSRAVAEMTLLLMLSSLRCLRIADGNLRTGLWVQPMEVKDQLREIGGLTVGLVGFGNTAQILADILSAMGAEVVYANRSKHDGPYRHVSMEELASMADIVSLHVPLVPETQHLVDAAFLARMKPGSVLVNTARGELVDEAALYDALVSGQLASAGLDVFDGEPATKDNPLFALENVTATPHIAWLTQQTWRRSIAIAVANARAAVAGKPLQFRVV